MAGREDPQSEAYSETENAEAGSFGEGFGGVAVDFGDSERAGAIAPRGRGEGVDAGGCAVGRLGRVRREDDAPGNGVVLGVNGEYVIPGVHGENVTVRGVLPISGG